MDSIIDIDKCTSCGDCPILPSLFPKVTPTSINFRYGQDCCIPCKQRRKKLFSHLTFVEIPESPVIMKMISDTGLTLIPFTPKSSSWFGFLNHTPAYRKNSIGDARLIVKHCNQKYNWMPGSETLDYKAELWKNYKRYQDKFGEGEFSFYLKCFILPEQFPEFKDRFEKRGEYDEMWIYKPSTGHRLGGIEIIGNLQSLPNYNDSEEAVAQLILKDPLLINDNRMEPRYSVLVTSVHPLRVFVYNEAIVKMFENYEKVLKSSNSSNENVPLVDIMKMKRSTLTEFWRDMTSRGYPVKKMQADIEEIILKSLCMGERLMGEETQKWMPQKRNVYQYWSFDFMWDKDLNTYLIEINRSPAYAAADTLEYYRRHAVDMLNLVGFEVNLQKTGQMPMSNGENGRIHETQSQNMPDLNGLVSMLRLEDVKELMDAEDELNRMKGSGFTRIFPTNQTNRYWKYLETEDLHPYIVQDEWEKIFQGENRGKAVKILQDLYDGFIAKNAQKLNL